MREAAKNGGSFVEITWRYFRLKPAQNFFPVLARFQFEKRRQKNLRFLRLSCVLFPTLYFEYKGGIFADFVTNASPENPCQIYKVNN